MVYNSKQFSLVIMNFINITTYDMRFIARYKSEKICSTKIKNMNIYKKSELN